MGVDNLVEDNGRVTTKEFYNEIIRLRQEVGDMERRLSGRFDDLGKLANAVGQNSIKICDNTDEIDRLREKVDKVTMMSGVWNSINTIAAALAGYFGIK